MQKEGFKYFAFISYSHKDKKTAKKLQKFLQNYHLPSKLQKSYPGLPKNLKPVFIDESNLVGTGLQEALNRNLESSNYIIVICSPSSAKSEYVNDEVEYFISLGRRSHIIPLIVDGVPHSDDPSKECFPPALIALQEEYELLGIDMTKFGARDSFLRVIAVMLGLDLDNFISWEAGERKKRLMIFSSAVLAVAVSHACNLAGSGNPVYVCLFWVIHAAAFCVFASLLFLRFRYDILLWMNRIKAGISDINLLFGMNHSSEEKESLSYQAFISCSSNDKKIAASLHKRLEHYHLPSNLRKSNPELPGNLRPIFFDWANLFAEGALKTLKRENLDKAKYILVVCSPDGAKSEYVNSDVDYSIRSGRINSIIPIIASGEPHSENDSLECLPPAIRALPREQELLGIDLRRFGIRDGCLRVIATMLHLDIDRFVLIQAKERRKKTMAITAAAAVFFIFMGLHIWRDNYFMTKPPHLIGNMYFDGTGSAQDYSKALEWYQKAADNGNSQAQYNIGLMYENGLGVEQDYSKALEWYEKSARNGNSEAQKSISRIKQLMTKD